MSLSKEFDERLKAAMKARDQNTLKVIRMVKTRIKNHAIEKRIDGEVPDGDVQQIVASYVKQLKKSLPEFEKGGSAAQDAIAGIKFEIEYLEPFLPQFLDEAQTHEIVAAVVEQLGNPPLQKTGMVIGRIMKEHKGQVDPLLVRRLVEETLGK